MDLKRYAIFIIGGGITACGGSKVSVIPPSLPVPGNQKVETAPSGTMDIYQVPSMPINLDMGKGVNSALGLTEAMNNKSTCVDGTNSSMGNSSSGSIKIDVRKISSNEEYYRNLNIDFAMSVAANEDVKLIEDMISGHVNTTAKHFNEVRIKADHSYMLITAEKIFLPINLKNPTVSAERKTAFKKYPEKFAGACGDSFVSSIMYGTRIRALVDCSNDSIAEKETNDITIEAAAKTVGTQGSGTLKVGMQNIANKSKNKCRIMIEAHGGKGELPTNFDDFAQKSIDYVTNSTLDTAAPIAIGTSTYNTITNDVEFLDLMERVKVDVDYTKSIVNMNKLGLNAIISEINALEYRYFINKNNINWVNTEGIALIRKINEESLKAAKIAQHAYKCATNLGNRKICDSDSTDGSWGDGDLE